MPHAEPPAVIPPASRRARDWALTWIALLLLLAWDLSPLDLLLIRPWASAEGFAWQNHWLTRQLIHDGGRGLAWGLLLALGLNLWRPFTPLLTRGQRGAWLAATLLGLLVVPAVKQLSLTSCPWEMAEFGGQAGRVWHWLLRTSDGGAGHCFPSGHAVSAFAFFSGWFALRGAYPKAARAWLAAVLAIGALFGFSQMVRGAHHPSHTMWSAWLCWAINVAATRWPAPANLRDRSLPPVALRESVIDAASGLGTRVGHGELHAMDAGEAPVGGSFDRAGGGTGAVERA